jgi:hypothetical protein
MSRSRADRARLVAVQLPLFLFGAWLLFGIFMLNETPKEWVAVRDLRVGNRLSAADFCVRAPVEIDKTDNDEDKTTGSTPTGTNAANTCGECSAPRGADLKALGRRYVSVHTEACNVILRESTSDRPLVVPAAGMKLLFVPLKNHLALQPFLNAGTAVTLCWEKCSLDGVVRAVVCQTGDSECSAAVEFSAPSPDWTVGKPEEARIVLPGQ